MELRSRVVGAGVRAASSRQQRPATPRCVRNHPVSTCRQPVPSGPGTAARTDSCVLTDRSVRIWGVSVRERLLRTAADLFYRDGITATGVDRVVETSGVSKPALYSHFRSKSGLVTAVLTRRHEQRVVELDSFLEAAGADPRRQLQAVFTWLERLYAQSTNRGCAFLNAAAEVTDPADPARAVIAEQKKWFRELLTNIVRRIGVREPERVGSQILLLIDGMNSSVLVYGNTAMLPVAREAAMTLVNSDLPTARP